MTAKVECCCPECGAEFAAKPEGGHRLLCGDSTVATDVERVLGGIEPHLMVTDPPYGVEYDPAWRNRAAADGTIGQKHASRAIGQVVNDDRADWREAWALFPGSVAYIWHAGTKAGIGRWHHRPEACESRDLSPGELLDSIKEMAPGTSFP